MTDRRPEAAEAIGVFFLVFAGGAAALTGFVGPVGVALAFGFAIVVLVYGLGHVCGAHFNPAITLAFAATGHFPWRRVPTYVLAQLVGATLAALALRLVFPDVTAAATHAAFFVTPAQAFLIEALATFLLALVIIGVATDRRATPGAAGLAIGLAVAVDALAFGPLTGASMNPARSFGPALVTGAWSDLWIYVAAPIAGALFAMAAYEALRPGRLAIEAKAPLGALGPIEGMEEHA